MADCLMRTGVWVCDGSMVAGKDVCRSWYDLMMRDNPDRNIHALAGYLFEQHGNRVVMAVLEVRVCMAHELWQSAHA